MTFRKFIPKRIKRFITIRKAKDYEFICNDCGNTSNFELFIKHQIDHNHNGGCTKRKKLNSCCRDILHFDNMSAIKIIKKDDHWVVWDRNINLEITTITFCPFCGTKLE